MPAINLQHGLESLYTFDTLDYDGQRNIVRDRSGHGRHLSLTGGVTTGVQSPVGQAASLDGADDSGYWDGEYPNHANVTVAALIRADGSSGALQGDSGIVSHTRNTGGISGGWAMEHDGFTFADANGDTVKFEDVYSPLVDEWEFRVVRVDDTDGWTDLWQNGDQKARKTYPTPRSSPGAYGIGVGVEDPENPSRRWYPGEIAFAASWRRLLSVAEIQHATRMTARRVSYL